MNVVTYEAVVENGHVQLPPGVTLPENAKVYVVVPGMTVEPAAHIRSPRLADPSQAVEFEMEVIKESPDAGV
jgi:hypothetical protein